MAPVSGLLPVGLLLPGGPATFRGKHFQLQEAFNHPPPAQSPRPPIWLGAKGGDRSLRLAAQHADDFASRAAQHDRENSFPFENFDAMRASGYTNMPIPAELGGGGASLLDICLAQERLARGDAPTALAVNMHLGLLWVMGDLWRASGEPGHHLLEKVAQERLIVFGAVSDPAVDSLKGATGFGYTTVQVRHADGYYGWKEEAPFDAIMVTAAAPHVPPPRPLCR